MDATCLGFPKGVTLFLDQEAVARLPMPFRDLRVASLSTEAKVITGDTFGEVAEDFIDMEDIP